MLEAVLDSLNNWFDRDPMGRPWGKLTGTFEVSGGSLALPDGFVAENQYYRVEGSVFNDGLHRHPDAAMADETFEGTVRALHVPQAVIDMAGEIAEWCEKHQDATRSPYQSESFGGYTYSKGDGGADGWKQAFAPELRRWRKL